jgi:hypothetical protein
MVRSVRFTVGETEGLEVLTVIGTRSLSNREIFAQADPQNSTPNSTDTSSVRSFPSRNSLKYYSDCSNCPETFYYASIFLSFSDMLC